MKYYLFVFMLLVMGCDATTDVMDTPESQLVTLRIQSTADSMDISYSTETGLAFSDHTIPPFTYSYLFNADSIIVLSGVFHCQSQSIPCNARMDISIDDEVVQSKDLNDFLDGEDTEGNQIIDVRQQRMGIYYNYAGDSYEVTYRIAVEQTNYYGSTSIMNGLGALQQLGYDAPRTETHTAEWTFAVEPGFEALLIEHQRGRRGETGPYFTCSEGGIYTTLNRITLPMYAAQICGNSPQIFTIGGIVEE